MPNATLLDQWQRITSVEDIPILGARVIKAIVGEIAIFRNTDNEIFAVLDKCPHKGGAFIPRNCSWKISYLSATFLEY